MKSAPLKSFGQMLTNAEKLRMCSKQPAKVNSRRAEAAVCRQIGSPGLLAVKTLFDDKALANELETGAEGRYRHLGGRGQIVPHEQQRCDSNTEVSLLRADSVTAANQHTLNEIVAQF